ncbi:MAG: cytochrome B [Cyclobacteriaceae bacterium]|nr:cytochrome B [Cyclobacteriaceae bacterium]
MHSILLATHSIVRYFLLIVLIIVIVRSLMGWMNRSSYSKLDDKFSLGLFILTHTQLLLGFALFFISPLIIFSGAAMGDRVARYWLAEHNTGMILAIVLITVARISSKKMKDDVFKHKRMFTLNAIALLIILVMIGLSHRGYFSITY